MKNKMLPTTILCTILICFCLVQETHPKLSNVYASGRARLVKELVINDETMPEGIFFESVDDIARDEKGHVYILDHEACNIKKFTSSGKFVKTIGSKGQGPGEFNWPGNLTVSKDRLLVWDTGNRKIQVYTLDGEFLTSKIFERRMTETGSYFPSLKKMKSLPNGDLVIHMELRHYGKDVKPQECTINIYSSNLEHKKILFSADIWREKIMLLSGYSDIVMPFPSLVYWDVTPEGKIIIGFSDKYEIGIYDSVKGQIASFSHSYSPVKVTEEDKKNFFDSTKYWYSRMGETGMMDYPKKYRQYATFPEFLPPFNNIIVDSEGNILVFGSGKRQGTSKIFQHFDVFSPEGKFLKKVVFDQQTPSLTKQMFLFTGSSIWTKEVDKNELIQVVRYRISN